MIERLSIKEFTCFDELNIDFSKNINIISGENGIGKTHILKFVASLSVVGIGTFLQLHQR